MGKKIIKIDEENGKYLIVSPDIRSCKFIAECIVNRFGKSIDLKLIDISNDVIHLKTFNHVLNKAFNSLKKGKIGKKLLLENIQFHYDKEFLHLEYFKWIKNSKDICMWVWLKYCTDSFLYSPFIPINHNERFNRIVERFDSINELERHQKRLRLEKTYNDLVRCNYNGQVVPLNNDDFLYHYNLMDMEILKQEWAKIYSEGTDFSWIDKNNEEQCHWIFNHYRTKKINKLIEIAKINMNNLRPINKSERYLMICSVINCISPNEKNKFITNIRTLWLQSKRRKKKESLLQKKSKKIKSKNSNVKAELNKEDSYALDDVNAKLESLVKILDTVTTDPLQQLDKKEE